jgi:hypothetical protein
MGRLINEDKKQQTSKKTKKQYNKHGLMTKNSTKMMYSTLQMIGHKNHLNRKYGSKDMKGLKLVFELELG